MPKFGFVDFSISYCLLFRGFQGDLEQLSIVSNPGYVNLQCAPDRVPIIDPEADDTIEAIQEKSGKHIVMRVHKDVEDNKID